MQKQILKPAYYDHFSCIGSSCEDTCCAGWKVTVDKATFKKYRKATSGPLAGDLKKNITRERKNPSESNYAKITLDNQGRCNFLNEENLCKIHAELGEESLCNTCMVYPRNYIRVDNSVELSLTPSCPEAARLILNKVSGIDFISDEANIASKTLFAHALFTNSAPLFWELRMYSIEIIQDRTQSIENRLIVLGLFLQKLTSIPKEQWQLELPTLMNRYRMILHDKEQLALLTNLPKNTLFQLQIARNLISQRISLSRIANNRYRECLDDLLHGLSLFDDSPIEQALSLYNEAIEIYFDPFMQDNSYLFENYLVNHMFSKRFPYETNNLFDNYMMLSIHFMMLRLHLLGMAQKNKCITKEQVIKLIQSYTKTVDHNPTYLQQIKENFHQANYSTMAHMIVLIK